MTAPQRWPALELVPDAKPTDVVNPGAIVDVEAPETWEAETVLAQWEPEHQLVGALMWMTAAQAQPILDLVPDTAIWRPTSRWAYVMYSRTLFGSLKRLAFGALLRRWSALAANPRIYALRGPVIDEAPR